MKFGAQVSAYRTSWDDIRPVVETMDAGRWSSVWFADHFVPPNRPRSMEPQPAYEAFALAAAVASITETLRIGHLVLGNTYRNPALVAKIAGSIDHISHGRFVLGIGAAWFEREHQAYGWDFPSMKERQDRFQEAMQLLRALFHAQEPVDFRGEYYQLDQASLSPGSYDTPIPILVGGTGEKRTLRTLAMHGDMLNLDGWAGQGVSGELLRHKMSVVEKHCADVGRDPAEITPTVMVPVRLTDDEASAKRFVDAVGPNTVAGSKDYVIERVGELIDAGAQEIMFGLLYNTPEDFQALDEDVLAHFD
ncbi:MAG: Flavin-dependent oxidoreductase, luciferase family [Chloroflexi bacterium]|nr:MAG: Flavin-dependent oxidoreductase, luciferase family [Chloroflexota bacterium]